MAGARYRTRGARRHEGVLRASYFALAAAVVAVVLMFPPAVSGGSVAGARVTLRGVYTVVHGDARLVDETLYFLRTPRHNYRLKFAVPPRLRPQTKVEVTGRLSGDTVDLGDGGASSIAAIAAPPPLATTGSKKVLAILVTWSGSPITATPSVATNFLFGSDSRTVASYYTETTYGQLTWTGDVTP